MTQFAQSTIKYLGDRGFEIERLFAYEIDDTELADSELLLYINNFISVEREIKIEIFNEARNVFVKRKPVVIHCDPELESPLQAESVRIETGDLKIKHKNFLYFRKINDDCHIFYESFEETHEHNLEFLIEILDHFFMSSLTRLRTSEYNCMINSISKLKADLRLRYKNI